jgi:hypothetical protein
MLQTPQIRGTGCATRRQVREAGVLSSGPGSGVLRAGFVQNDGLKGVVEQSSSKANVRIRQRAAGWEMQP